MSIGLFSDAFAPAVDGVATTVENYARCIAKSGHQCSVIVPETPGVEYEEPYRVLTFSSLPLNQRPPYRLGLPGIDARLHGQLRKARLDLVHAHSPFGAGMEAMHYARLYNRPLVATFHSKYYDDFLQVTRSPFLASKMLQSVMHFYEKADHVWTVNNSTAETMRDYGFRGPIEIMSNGTDLRMPEDIAARRAKVDERYGLAADERVLLFVGQHVWQKNLRMLLEAMAQLLMRTRGKPKVRLLSVGSGYALDDIKAMVRSLGIEQDVIFAGAVHERDWLCSVYLRADLFIFPSVYDNAPLVVREAAAMQCPSILVRGTNAAKDTQENVNAFWCGNSVNLLAERIETLLSTPEEIERVGKCARDQLARPWDDIMPKVLLRYGQIIEEHAAGKKKRYKASERKPRRVRRRPRRPLGV